MQEDRISKMAYIHGYREKQDKIRPQEESGKTSLTL
jgi:hypothetical protein